MLEEVEAIDNIREIVKVKGIDVLFIGRATCPIDGLPGTEHASRSAGADGEGREGNTAGRESSPA
jgi:hypothetical protein